MYSETIEYLYGLQRFGIKFGLENISRILESIGSPHERLRAIHIAGTNGKGSTAAFIESILIEEGYKVGLYTSPHLVRFTERIRINYEEITEAKVEALTGLIRSHLNEISITFFEFVTAMAFLYFEEEKVDFAILETGMGGRLDATNVCRSIISIITNISMEHRFYLGKTVLQIAREKAGIIRDNGVVISGVTQRKVRELIERKCKERDASHYLLGRDFSVRIRDFNRFDYIGINGEILRGLRPALKGRHQGANLSLALTAVEIMNRMGFRVSKDSIFRGVERAKWRGRLEVVADRPKVVLDGAHNPDAMRKLRDAIEKDFRYRSLWIVMGVMDDKDYRKMIGTLHPLQPFMIFCRAHMERSLNPDVLVEFVRGLDIEARRIDEVGDALAFALERADEDDLILVTGSLFVVGEAISWIEQRK